MFFSLNCCFATPAELSQFRYTYSTQYRIVSYLTVEDQDHVVECFKRSEVARSTEARRCCRSAIDRAIVYFCSQTVYLLLVRNGRLYVNPGQKATGQKATTLVFHWRTLALIR